MEYDFGKAAKLPSWQENPIDQLFIAGSEAVSPYMKKLHATPNMITTACVVASLLAVRSVYVADKPMFVAWAIFAYFLDCLDGHFARKFDMCTVFGDYYDHITDWLYYGLLFYAAFCVRGFKPAYKPYAAFIYMAIGLATLGMMYHFGCQESIYTTRSRKRDAESPTLGLFTKIFNYPDPENTIHFSKYVGSGTYMMLIIALIVITIK